MTKSSRRSITKTPKGQEYEDIIARKTMSKIQNKELQTKVDDLIEGFGKATI